jgi:hypothetical protein
MNFNLEINDWSIILFFFNFLFYVSMAFAILSKPQIEKFLIVLIAWIFQQAALIYFGIKFDLIGLVLIGVTEVVFSLMLFLISKRVVDENN